MLISLHSFIVYISSAISPKEEKCLTKSCSFTYCGIPEQHRVLLFDASSTLFTAEDIFGLEHGIVLEIIDETFLNMGSLT